MKFFYRIGADAVFLFHSLWIAIGMFGWLMPSLWYLYLIILVSTLLSYFTFQRCIFTVWEFNLRRKVDSTFTTKSDWLPYYTHKFAHQRISDKFILHAGVFSLACNIN